MNHHSITPGTIEAYCLGLLAPGDCREVERLVEADPDLRRELDEFMLSIEKFALANAVDPGEEVRLRTFNLIHNLQHEQQQDLGNLALLNKFSDSRQWLRIVEPLLPQNLEGMFVHELRNDGQLTQTLIWAEVDYPDEVHDDEEECFIILKGRCRCFIGDEIIELGPGGFIEVPMFVHHNIEMIEPVLAVVQRKKVA